MRRRHLVSEATDETFCGKPIDRDTIDWTYRRGHATCAKCLEESKPEPPLPDGHAARELERLRIQNGLRNGVKFKPRVKERRLLRIMLEHDAPTSATLIAFDAGQDVSTTLEQLQRLLDRGAVRKLSTGYVIETEQPVTGFVPADPEAWNRRGIRTLKGQMFN